LLSPETPRQIQLRTRTAEWTSAMAAAMPATALITAAVALLTTLLGDAAQVALFGFATLLGAWTVLTISKFQEGSTYSPMHRRAMLLCGGIAVGAVVFQLEQLLYVDLSGGPLAHRVSAPFAEIG